MVGPKKQAFCPRINILNGNFDTNYSVVGVVKVDYLNFSMKFLKYSRVQNST